MKINCTSSNHHPIQACNNYIDLISFSFINPSLLEGTKTILKEFVRGAPRSSEGGNCNATSMHWIKFLSWIQVWSLRWFHSNKFQVLVI